MDELEQTEARRDIEVGRRASNELDLTRNAFDQIKKATLERIIYTAPEEQALRERLIVTVQILDVVKKSLMNAVECGEAAINLIEAYNARG